MNAGLGALMYQLANELFPICRSISGDGVRETFTILKQHIPGLKTYEVPSGTKCFDWTVPKEWNIRDAYVIDPDGKKIIDFQKSNLHVLGYSIPIDQFVTLDELQLHLHSFPEQPTAIPYVTSYYKETWGFCLTHEKRSQLKSGKYRVYIDSKLTDGNLTYGELILRGDSEKEVFLSTYICHPSMANNELSGPVVTAYLAKWLDSLKNRKYTYRIIYIPETIGSITYLSRNLESMKKKVIAGFNITCVGDDHSYSFLPSRLGHTLADKVALHALNNCVSNYIPYSFLARGSDERQYCSPGIDLPVCSIMRSKYGEYPEYHTSLDDMSFISPEGLQGGYDVLKKCIEILEINTRYRSKVFCEPHLGSRGLYPTISNKKTACKVRNIKNFLAYADGENDLVDIAETLGVFVEELFPVLESLLGAGLIEISA